MVHRKRSGEVSGSGEQARSSVRIAPSPAERFSWSNLWAKHHLAMAVVVNTVFLIAGGLSSAKGGDPAMTTGLFVIAYVAGGMFSLREGLESLFKERRIDVDLLMVMAAVAAASIGEWLEGGILLFLFALSNAMQFYAMDRTRRAITDLMNVRPREALLKDDSGETTLVPIEQLRPGHVIVVRPGELVPIDGRIVAGTSSLEEASITGESVPADKTVGDDVFGGTLNRHGVLEVRVTKLAEDTVIAKIIRMVEEAQSEEAPTQRRIDRIEQYYAVAVIGMTVLAAIIPIMLGVDRADAIYRAITLMVVASPCAVAMAVPAPVVAAIANGARSGVLFKGGVHIENMAEVAVIVFDKIGTLTWGEPTLTDVVALGDEHPEEVLRWAASAESHSEHPLARAILQAAEEHGIDLMEVADTRALPGKGLTATVHDRHVWIGNRRLGEERTGGLSEDLIARVAELEREGSGQTVMFVGIDDRAIGLLSVVDALRPGTPAMVEQLRKQGVRRIVMLTGDNRRVAEAIAAQAGIDEVHAELLPGEKADIIERLRETVGPVAMVGDGVNDAPALAKATVGVAMGAAGTDVALETADVVLMTNDLAKLNHAVTLSRRAKHIIGQNLAFALGVIGVLVVWVLLRGLDLALGVVGHEGSTILVILNSLRLLFNQHRSTGVQLQEQTA